MPDDSPTSTAHKMLESDPTSLTTQQLIRELSWLREVIEVRLEGMDKAMVLFNDNITRVPTDTDTQIQHLKELHEEKFDSIQLQFKERDTRAEQTSKDSNLAVDAAFQAAKEAVGEQNKSSALAIAKSEASTTKQIDAQAAQILTATGALRDMVDDLKGRLNIIEGRSKGVGDWFGYAVGGVGMIVGIAALFMATKEKVALPVQTPTVVYLPSTPVSPPVVNSPALPR